VLGGVKPDFAVLGFPGEGRLNPSRSQGRLEFFEKVFRLVMGIGFHQGLDKEFLIAAELFRLRTG